MRKPVGIWLRVSTEDQAKGDSPEHHEKRARYYAESKGWNVVEVYHLEGVSGKVVSDHPEAQRMVKELKQGRITGLIFSKLARLARNTKELLEFADLFRACDADLISLQESIDTSTPAGRLFYTMIAAMAQWEREEIADRVNASIAVRARLGKPLNGKAPFGYVWRDKKLEPHLDEAPVRRMMYDLYIEHRRKKVVARILNDAGYRTRDGSKWSDTSLERLIRDSTAKGMHRANFTQRFANGKHRVVKPESEWVWTPCEPIVSEEVWTKAIQLLDGNRQHQRRGRTSIHLFAGLTFCHCGRKMYVPTNTPKYVCQGCRTKIPIVDLEAIFREQMAAYFLSPKQVADQLAKADENIAAKDNALNILLAEREKVGKEVERIYRLYQEDRITSEAFGKFFQPLDERQKQFDDEIPRLQAEVDVLKVNHLSGDHILTESKTLYERWPKLNREEKKRIIESVTEKIVIGKEDQIDITLCYLPSSEELTKEQRLLRPP
jgi:site-specific DNA recombinase